MFSTVPVITEQGMTLLLRAASGVKITLIKFQVGSGTLETGEDPKSVTALKHIEIDDIGITHVKETEQEGYIELQGHFDNQNDVVHDFTWTEIGLIARVDDEDADDYNTQYLYAYANDGQNAGRLKAAKSDVITEQTLSLIIAIGESENISAYILPGSTYVLLSTYNEHVNTVNAHGCTAATLGLGNVPNVSTNNQTPTWTNAAELQKLVSGERLSIILGKIAKAIDDLIAHIGNISNPHKVSYSQTGAAAASHKHSAGDINSGTLPVSRGGTGTNTDNGLATKFYNLLKAKFANISHNHSATDDIVGVLPIGNGGTGVNTQAALDSLIASFGFIKDPRTPAIGVFKGDGSFRKDINVGFTPSRVFISRVTNGSSIASTSGIYYFEPGKNLYHSSCPASYKTETDPNVMLTEHKHGGALVITNGFAVGYSSGNYTYINQSNIDYMYIAIP